jgi:hypothetical protein
VFIERRCAKAFNGPCQILTHQLQCEFDVLMVAGPALSAFARSLKIPYLNNLTHLLSTLLLIDHFLRQRGQAASFEFLTGRAFSCQRVVSALGEPQYLAGNSVHDVEFSWS